MIGGALHVAARLWENVRADRSRPPLAQLAAIADPERFVWRILPYAARSFSFCIAVLPRRSARTLAVAYCYCRMLDTCEDLAPDAARKEAALAAFLARFDDGARRAVGLLAPPPRIEASLARDARDAVYLLLLERAALVDAFFATLPPDHQEAVIRLVRRMGAGMRWAVATFAAQGGTLRDAEQRSRYCLEVLGHPMRFAEELQRLEMGLSAELPSERVALAAQAGEAIQLANVARDLEKDHAIGVTYLAELRAPPQPPSPARFAAARRLLLARALDRGAAFRPFMEALPSPRVSLARAGGLLMALFTLAFWQGTAARLGLPIVAPDERITPRRSIAPVVRSVFSRAAFVATLARLDAAFRAAAQRLAQEGPSESS